MSQPLLSGEPLPLTPPMFTGRTTFDAGVQADLNSFHHKIVDYLRRLTAKLSSSIYNPGLGSVPVISLILDADEAMAAAYTAIDWDLVVRRDNATYSYATPKITVHQDGLYLLMVDIGVDGYNANNLVDLQIVSNNGTLSWGDAHVYIGGSFAVQIPIPLANDDWIQVEIRDALTRNLLAESTRLTMVRIAAGSGVGSGGGGPSDKPGEPEDPILPWG